MDEAAGMAAAIGPAAGVQPLAMAGAAAHAGARPRGGAAKSVGGGLGLPTMGDMGALAKRSDLFLAFGVMGILVVLVFPMPPLLLDLLLAVSIIVSVLILMTSLFIEEPLEFSSFPTVLLVATMLRLALNLASTRLILGHGHEGTAAAGHVIEAFGHFVMGGNFVIGVIVFAILIIVNFVVITKGSGRIAEVAARFTLDAMPGKQMAIDADLSAGLIDEKVAKERRKALEDESSFFGAMDGASKFVRGDAIAALLITFINVIGGIIIGVMQQGMGFGEAAKTYTLLTCGDGLVSQVPALIVSTAAGLLVSKAGVRGAADKAMGRQLSNYPKALGMSAAVMGGIALLPGIPMLPFLSLAAGAAWLARKIDQAEQGARRSRHRKRRRGVPGGRRRRVRRRKSRSRMSSRSTISRSRSATPCCRSSTRRTAPTASPSRSRLCAASSPARPASSCRRCASSTTCSSTPTNTSSASRRSRPAPARSSRTCTWPWTRWAGRCSCPATTCSSRPSGCRRPGSTTACATRRSSAATPWSTPPPSCRPTSPRSSRATCPSSCRTWRCRSS